MFLWGGEAKCYQRRYHSSELFIELEIPSYNPAECNREAGVTGWPAPLGLTYRRKCSGRVTFWWAVVAGHTLPALSWGGEEKGEEGEGKEGMTGKEVSKGGKKGRAQGRGGGGKEK